jgi:hypothetical protein
MHVCTDDAAWSLALALHLLGIVADPARIQRDSGKSEALAEDDLLRAAKRFPVKARAVSSSVRRLAKTPLPALALLRSGAFVVIGKVTEDSVLIQGQDDPSPRLLGFEAFEREWSGRLILLTKRTALSDTARRFDLTWFWGAIHKYRGILLEVLAVSFVIQLFALATPMIFQTVIDKVLVHRGMSTLEVMVSGLALIAIFEALLSGLRTYMFSPIPAIVSTLSSAPASSIICCGCRWRISRAVASATAWHGYANSKRSGSLSPVPPLRWCWIWRSARSSSPSCSSTARRWPFDRCRRTSALCVAVGRHHAGVPPPARREIPPRRGKSGFPGRERHRRRNTSRRWRSSRRCSIAGRSSSPAMSRPPSRCRWATRRARACNLLNKGLLARG